MDEEIKWQFYINGHSQELRQYSEQISSKYFDLHGGIDHWHDCKNDDFRLSSAFFEEENDSELVWQIGYELVSLFNGVSFILNKKHRPIVLEKLLLKGSPLNIKPHRLQTLALLGSPKTFKDGDKSDELERSKRDPRYFMLNLATEREDVYLLLRYFDMPLDWVGLYKIFETIKQFSESTGFNFAPDKDDKNSFTLTANKYQFSGLQSRHGFTKAIKDIKTQPMQLDEAYDFITSLAKDYLNQVGKLVLNQPDQKYFRLPT